MGRDGQPIPAEQMQPGAEPPPGTDTSAPAENQQGDQDTFENMVAGLTEFIFGKGKQGIVDQLRASKDIPQTIGEIAFSLLTEAGKQAEESSTDIDMDILLGVASEVIDSLIRMVDALKIDAPEDDAIREQAMIVAVQSYLSTAKPGSDEQEAAKQVLMQMQSSGTVDEGAAQLKEMGARRGVDPFAEQAPPEQAPPEQTPPQAPLMNGGP